MSCPHCGQDEPAVPEGLTLYLVNLHRKLIGLPPVTRAGLQRLVAAIQRTPGWRGLGDAA